MAEQTWHKREAPILEAVAAAENEGANAGTEWIAERTGLPARDVGLGLKALWTARYVDGIDATAADGVPYFMSMELLERGRRAVGSWPREGNELEGFLDLLTERIEATGDEDERSRLERLRDAAQGVGAPVLSGVLLAYLKSRIGLE